MIRRHSIALLFVLLLLSPACSRAESDVWEDADWAMTATLGNSYSPGNEIRFAQFGVSATWDYRRSWAHRAPQQLKFKVESAAGLARTPHTRAILNANMLAVYPLTGLTRWGLAPFVEAGIGLIYTDYQVDDQGLRVNFNPLLGIGTRLRSDNGPDWFVTARLHHVSNGGLHHDNQGINAVILQLGRSF